MLELMASQVLSHSLQAQVTEYNLLAAQIGFQRFDRKQKVKKC